MRIAILVYGRLNKCVEHYNNILEKIGKENTIDFFLSSDNSPQSQLNEFIDLYKPVKYNNDSILYQINLDKYPKRDETNIHNMICHFINKRRVFSLLENHVEQENIHYDIVVSLRIDLVFHNIFNFNNVVDNTIYIPTHFDYIDKAINDQVAYGTINVIKKYTMLISNIFNLLDNGTLVHPESLNYSNILFHNLKIERVDLSYFIER